MTTTQSSTALPSEPIQILIFTVGAENYAVDALRVQEIRGSTSMTRVPNAPPHLAGLLNLRGSVIPVFDLRERFGMPVAGGDRFRVTVIVHLGPRLVGMIVDSVSDVVSISRDEIGTAPELGVRGDGAFLDGTICTKDALVLLVDVDRLLAVDLEPKPLRIEDRASQ